MDPYEPLGQLAHPFCFFGFAPTLFDAPSRESRAGVDWTAHSFLCFIAGDRERREARAILGFSWGFSIRDELFSYHSPAVLSSADWDDHLSLLGQEHPTWDFADGFHTH
jgi:hypothetical protein